MNAMKEESSNPTVFVVDDDSGMRSSLGHLMSSASFQVETFESGREFLGAIDAGRFGCLILDLRLKEGSGLEVQDELRRRNVPLPIIVLTGHGNVPDAVRAMKAGAFDFLQKPPPAATLLERVRAAIASDRVARAARREHADALDRLSALPDAERNVRSLLMAGGASQEVATDLAISMRQSDACSCGHGV